MFQLMIIDDEYFVRRGIIDSIPWETYHIDICAEASNGMEALEKLLDGQPDVIVTDIRMGKMDGLNFIEICKKKYPDIKFIILSGHNDFEYARQAVKLGVSEYLSKPVGAEELIEAIINIKTDLETQKPLYLSKASDYQNSILLNWNTPKPVSSIETTFFQVFVFSILNVDEVILGQTQQNKSRTLQDLTYVVQDYFHLASINHIVKMDYQNMFVVTLNYSYNSIDFRQLIHCFRDYLNSKTGASIFIGCGNLYLGYSSISNSYNEAFSVMMSRSLSNKSETLYACDLLDGQMKDYMYNTSLNIYKPNIRKLISGVVSDINNVDKEIHNLFRKIAAHNLDRYDIVILCTKLFTLCINNIDTSSLNKAEILKLESFRNQSYLDTSTDIEESVIQFFLFIKELQHFEAYGTYKSIVTTIIKYVCQHYHENVSLNILAQIVHVTPNYLSRIFKDTTGENFKEWLIKFRIEKSKELLQNPSLKVYEVGIMVGFKDYKYFSCTFKKYVGCSAREYQSGL